MPGWVAGEFFLNCSGLPVSPVNGLKYKIKSSPLLSLSLHFSLSAAEQMCVVNGSCFIGWTDVDRIARTDTSSARLLLRR